MLCSGNHKIRFAKIGPAILALALLVTTQSAIRADNPAPGAEAITVAPSGSAMSLLPDVLAGQKATSDLKLVGRDNLAEIVAEKASIYQEYFVASAGAREYAAARVEVFETRNQFAALGLFQFNIGVSKANNGGLQIGSEGAQLENAIIFWKGNFFVRISGSQSPARGTSAVHETLARAVANSIVTANPGVTRPPLFDSLPSTFAHTMLVPGSGRYFLGPESLNAFVEHGRDMFEFRGDTEAVVAQYARVERASNGGRPETPDRTKEGSIAIAPAAAMPLKLVIVECHTPEFATDEIARVSSYVQSLSEAQKQSFVFKRTGNYIVVAVSGGDRQIAEGLVNSVQYPYTVKWLRNPLWPTNDPFRAQKAAEMLLSTFGILGLILLTVLAVGTIFGTSVFLKRRKRQQEIFTDAGGMLRLDIEPFMLALPPKRDE